MKSFIAALIAVVAIAYGASLLLETYAVSSTEAGTTSNVRLN